MAGVVKKIRLSFFAGFILFTLSSFTANPVPAARTIILNVLKSIAHVHTLIYKLDYMERKANGKMRKDSSTIKYQKSPLRIYMKMSNGAEILWGPDMNGGNVLVHPNSFPYFNLDLDPNGSIMRKNQHHGIGVTGYAYFGEILKASMDKAGTGFDSCFLYLGEISFNGYRCYKLAVIDPHFRYIPYVVQKGETILTIARKLYLNEFMIAQHNNLGSYASVKAGQTIMVPDNYAREILLYIDEKTMLPVMMKVNDDQGLFEEYHFRSVAVNPSISPEEFTKDYKDYHF